MELLATPPTLEALLHWLRAPLESTAWTDWRGFWLRQIFDDRLVVAAFAPLLGILLLLRGDGLRVGIVLTGLLFAGFLFGVPFAAFLLLACIGLYWLGESFAVESQRTDVIRWGPPLAAGAIILGGYAATLALVHIHLPAELNAWLRTNLPWLFPYGLRGVLWEPPLDPRGETAPPPQLFAALFWNAHNVGTAYIAVKMLQYFGELRRAAIPKTERGLLKFLAWLCYAPTLIQGPIERYARFQEEIETCHERRGLSQVPPAMLRAAWGVAKVLVSTVYFVPVLTSLGLPFEGAYYREPWKIDSYALLYFGVFLQIFALYLEFSGYCDIAAAFSRLLGYRLVENFDWPWLATSLRDFWRRWHISLSAILRDYVYIALGGNRRYVLRNLVLTFLFCGLWHLPNLSAVHLSLGMMLWGALMGVMLYVNQRWVQWVQVADETAGSALGAVRRAADRLRPLPQVLAWVVTMHSFVFSLVIFFGGPLGLRVLWELVRRPIAALVGG